MGCRGVNHAALSQFMGQNKTDCKKKKKKITDSRTVRLCRSISHVKLLSDISSFFFLCTAFLHDIQCYSDYTKHYPAGEVG